MVLNYFSELLKPVEIIGILAGIVVLASFLLKGELRIRMLNVIGAVLFVIYGILIKSISVALINFIVVIIQIVYINKRRKENNEIK